MKSDRFPRGIDGSVLAVVALTLSAVFGTAGLTASGSFPDGIPQWPAVSPALVLTDSRQGNHPPAVRAAHDVHRGPAPVTGEAR